MRFVPIKSALAAIAGTLLVAGVALVAWDAIDDRDDLWAHAAAATGGDPSRGQRLFVEYGCGSCHGVKHVPRAAGMVGPPLDGIAVRAIVGGKLANNPENMQRWIRDPQSVTPGTAMPNLRVSERDARDITAFLYTRAE